jgi:hypothetical protein
MKPKKEQINPADAYRLAKAQELIWWFERGGIGPLPDKPSDKASKCIEEQYEVTDEIPPEAQA